MMNAVKNSVLGKVAGCMRRWYQKSLLFRTSSFFKKTYAVSKTKKVWRKFCATPNRAPSSFYGKAVGKLSSLLGRFAPAVERSKVVKLCRCVCIRLKSIVSKSFFLRPLQHLTTRRFIILCLVATVPVDYFFRNVIPSLTIIASAWDEALMLGAFVYLIYERASSAEVRLSRVTPIDSYLLLFMACGFFLMCAVSPYPSIAFAGYRAVCQYMLWFFLMIRLCQNDGDFKTFYYSFVALGLLLALHGIYQYIIAVPIPSGWVSQTEAGVRTRVFSIIGSPNILGSLFILTAPMAAALAYYFKDIRAKLAAWAVVGCMCLSLLFTFSRGAWVGTAVAVLVFAIFIDRRLIALMGGVGACALFFVPSIASRITYLFTSDYAVASMAGGRMIRWETGKLLLSESNPLLGFGLGRFGGAVAMQNQILEVTDEFEYFYMDNYYLKTAVEMGYIGLAFFIVLLFGLLLWSLRSAGRNSGDRMTLLGQAMVAGMCGVLVHCYFENIFEVPYMTSYFWAIAALVFYLGYFRKSICLTQLSHPKTSSSG